MNVSIPDCRDFTGYKPCHPGENGETCINPRPVGTRILIINIGAIGAVISTTTLLPAMKRKYPESTIHWLTDERAAALLRGNPYIDCIHPLNASSLLVLQQMKFDVVCNLDKTRDMGALINMLDAGTKLGFGMNENGVIIPLNKGAEYNYMMGINNKLKFSENRRTYLDIMRETCELDRQVDPYVFEFCDEEQQHIDAYRKSLNLDSEHPVLGINTGSSALFCYRRIPEKHIRTLIPELFMRNGGQKVLLLGGVEDTERNERLVRDFPDMTISTPTTEGLRRGMCYVELCDYVFSGDTLGTHMAIALGKYIIVYFNISCSPEIEIYGRGAKILSDAECSPCWKQDCDKGLVCLDEDIAGRMIDAFDQLRNAEK